jgi:hypothetical protein
MRLFGPSAAECLGKSVFSRAGGPTARDNQFSRAVVLYHPHGTKKAKNNKKAKNAAGCQIASLTAARDDQEEDDKEGGV